MLANWQWRVFAIVCLGVVGGDTLYQTGGLGVVVSAVCRLNCWGGLGRVELEPELPPDRAVGGSGAVVAPARGAPGLPHAPLC